MNLMEIEVSDEVYPAEVKKALVGLDENAQVRYVGTGTFDDHDAANIALRQQDIEAGAALVEEKFTLVKEKKMAKVIKFVMWLGLGVAVVGFTLNSLEVQSDWQYTVQSAHNGASVVVTPPGEDAEPVGVKQEPTSVEHTVDVASPLALFAIYVTGSFFGLLLWNVRRKTTA